MRHIICPECGEVDFYTNFDIQQVYICFDADGEETDNNAEVVSISSSVVPRCPYCQRKIKIVEVKNDDVR